MPELSINPGVEIRNAQLETHHFKVRLSLAFGFALVLSALLLARFAYLQVVRHEDLQTLAEANRISVVPVPPNRGIITDRNGVVLAHNYSAYTLEIQPREIEDIDGLIDRVSTLVEIGPRDRRRFKRLMEESKRVGSLPIRTRLSDEEIARFAAQRYRFPGVEINARLFRQYPQGELFSHVVGYIGRINQRELDRLEADDDAANYRGTDYIGKTGLELSYERLLHGSTGIEEVEVDSGGRAVRTLSRTPPMSGHNLILNIDAGLQEVAYNAIGGRRGALVAIDPTTGGVLAFVSKPGFDPNLFVDGIDPLNWHELNNSPDRPLLNRALSGTYPPGSTFKPFMALAALSLGRRTPEQAIQDPGFFSFGGRIFHDDKVGGHGMVDMYKSIVKSCDTYYYVLANDLGIDAISRFMGSIGFGGRTGIDITGEAAGVLPSRQWKQRRFKEKWYPGETISIGIGQGYNSYTPLQLAAAIATLANDGVMYRPHVVDYVEDSRKAERRPIEPKPVRTLDLDPRHIAVVKQALIGVNEEGTGSRAFAKAGYVSAGKTGTSQVVALKAGVKYVESKVKERFRDHALFVAYAPADRPRIALAVVVENAGFGSRSAAPVARKVLDYYLLGRAPANAPLRVRKDGSDASGG
ncbi:MAG: penicillin-binding protein 2 [Betaproteobacteria bacterium]|nr:penicillin-binding protein 2 [Betaproteobacteria bacterium]MDH3438345.1 penicillin-binding protein 2 [Betaproteobacteria bacterium]